MKDTPVVALTIMGESSQPFLGACLESIKDCVDLVVLNDNSSGKALENLKAVKKSALYRENKIEVLTSEFTGFAKARNLCLDYIGKLNFDLKKLWILKLDTDENSADQRLLRRAGRGRDPF